MFIVIMAALKAIPEIVSMIKMLVDEVGNLRQDAIDKSIDEKIKDIDATVTKIMAATTNTERAALAVQLNSHRRK